MTNITVTYKNNHIVSIESEGHSLFDVIGEDIVCAAISVLMATAINSLEVVAGLKFFPHEVDDSATYMYVGLPKKLDDIQALKSNVILETVLVGLESIENGYPKNIKLCKREV